jgi:hypothetical protein
VILSRWLDPDAVDPRFNIEHGLVEFPELLRFVFGFNHLLIHLDVESQEVEYIPHFAEG